MNTLGLSKPTWAVSPSRHIKTCHSLLREALGQTRPVSGLRGWGSAGSHTPEKSRSEKLVCPHPAPAPARAERESREPENGLVWAPAAPAPLAASECSSAGRQVQPGRATTGGPPLEPPSLAVQLQQLLLGLQVPQGSTLHPTYFPKDPGWPHNASQPRFQVQGNATAWGTASALYSLLESPLSKPPK